MPANLRFRSVEPLLGPIPVLPLAGIHWVIVGGESAPGARPHSGGARPEWVEEIYHQCRGAGVALFKPWGETQEYRAGWWLLGRTFDEMPGPIRSSGQRYHGDAASIEHIQR